MPGDDGANSAGGAGDDDNLVGKAGVHLIRLHLEHDTDAAGWTQPFAAEQAALFPDLEAFAIGRQPIIAGPEIEISGAVLGPQRLEHAAHLHLIVSPVANPDIANHPAGL